MHRVTDEEATRVMTERLSHDKDYGFDYDVTYHPLAVAPAEVLTERDPDSDPDGRVHADGARPRLNDYLVRWEIDAEAENAQAAANYADELRRDPSAAVGFYTVIDKVSGQAVDIDLDYDAPPR